MNVALTDTHKERLKDARNDVAADNITLPSCLPIPLYTQDFTKSMQQCKTILNKKQKQTFHITQRTVWYKHFEK
jgi:hypothetical protein